MSHNVRIATFNCENLFARYKFRLKKTADPSPDGWDINSTRFDIYDDKKRKLTARAIKGVKADVIVLVEVENLEVLKRFRSRYLGGFRAYPHALVVDGNDPRKIDIAILSKYPLTHVRSYQELKESPSKRSFIFSRDCLEVDVDIKGRTLTLFGNHLKSMMGGRSRTHDRRLVQARTVKKLIKQRFGSTPGNQPFIILGDFNDYAQDDQEGKSAIRVLTGWNQVYDVNRELPENERWTHYYKRRKKYSQLDYILVSNVLKPGIREVYIERRGQPPRADRFTGKRFPGVSNKQKASDHCPVVVELELE
jgi:endonuclease/exonuclease/phosphatase family metal-dependent hydrolase